jgi:hypothetical protein
MPLFARGIALLSQDRGNLAFDSFGTFFVAVLDGVVLRHVPLKQAVAKFELLRIVRHEHSRAVGKTTVTGTMFPGRI